MDVNGYPLRASRSERETNVHNGDARRVELVNGPLGRDADCADEELGLLLDDDVDELGQLALGVIILP